MMTEKAKLDHLATRDNPMDTTPSATMDLENDIDNAMADLHKTQKYVLNHTDTNKKLILTFRALTLIGPVAIHVLEKLQQKTNWAFMLLMGGLNENGCMKATSELLLKLTLPQLRRWV